MISPQCSSLDINYLLQKSKLIWQTVNNLVQIINYIEGSDENNMNVKDLFYHEI